MARVSIKQGGKFSGFTTTEKAKLTMEVKRFNRRIVALAERYGKDSILYTRAIQDFTTDDVLKSGLVHGIKSGKSKGILQITTGTKLLETKTGRDVIIQTRRKHITATEIEKTTREQLWNQFQEEYIGKKSTKAERLKAFREKYPVETIQKLVEKNVSMNDKLKDLKTYFYNHFTEDENREIMSTIYTGKGTGKKPSWEDIDELVRTMEDIKDSGEFDMDIIEEEYLTKKTHRKESPI